MDKRIFELEESFQYYELPYRLFYGTYFDGKGGKRSNDDLKEIKQNYPYIQTSKLKQNGEIGYIGSFFAQLLLPKTKKGEYFNKYYVMELSLFLTGVIAHLVFEYTGLNKWYCKKGYACTR